MPLFMYSRVTFKSPHPFCVPNLSTRLANITGLLRYSCNYSYFVSRAILTHQPGLPNLPEPDVGELMKFILLYIFVCLYVASFYTITVTRKFFFSIIVQVGEYVLLNIDCVCVCVSFYFLLLSLSLICHTLCPNFECTVSTCPDLTCNLSGTVCHVQFLAVCLSV